MRGNEREPRARVRLPPHGRVDPQEGFPEGREPQTNRKRGNRNGKESGNVKSEETHRVYVGDGGMTLQRNETFLTLPFRRQRRRSDWRG